MQINHFFESFMESVYPFGINYITGRDILMVILGFSLGIVVVLSIIAIIDTIKNKISKSK